ncbi:hypothetical protein P7H16_15495 [Paenibacillus larvae]|nr:hypothetical protein [Paenibacillus larvae]MDT2248060.1 hypothetical protein [Paenibacillus larvae]
MAERHGIYTTEAPFSVPTPVSPMATLPVVFGTAPVNLTALENPRESSCLVQKLE